MFFSGGWDGGGGLEYEQELLPEENDGLFKVLRFVSARKRSS